MVVPCLGNINTLRGYVERVVVRMMEVSPDMYPKVYKNWVKSVPSNRVIDFNFILKDMMGKRGLRWDWIEQSK